MDFRTEIKAVKEDVSIDYSTPIIFLGSCFASDIGDYLMEAKFDTLINPFGVLYNPESLYNALSILIKNKQFQESDLYNYQGRYLSFYHDTSFSSDNQQEALKKINDGITLTSEKLARASFLFITFGTARVYRLEESKEIVSNCHKMPADYFRRELLSVSSIVEKWRSLLADLRKFNPGLKVVFTVSPVRHWKDGAHGNQLSKSVLFLAIEELMKAHPGLSYFPSYELMMDELRDYRYYKRDMLHPSPQAVEFIWDYFCSTWLKDDTIKHYKEVSRIISACKHRIKNDDKGSLEVFSKSMIGKIDKVVSKYKYPDLSEEREYFSRLI